MHLHYTIGPLLGNPLTGTWVPDGRLTDPNLVLDTNARTALLSSFNGLDAHGSWTLFVADVSTGEQHRVADWSLKITGESVPEPGAITLLAAGCLATLPRRRRQGREDRRG